MSDELCIARWNTSLSPPWAPRENSEGRWTLATEVVRRLIRDEHVDLLVLGEVTPDDVERLRKSAALLDFWSIVDDRVEANRADIGALYDSSKLKRLGSAPAVMESSQRARPTTAAYPIDFKLTDGSRLCLFAAHWRSQRERSHEQHRRAAADALRDRIADSRSLQKDLLGVVVGDFNDEPGSDSIERHLRASRDRELARNTPGMLYNPSWRLLGERRPHAPGESRRSVAGTHRYREPEPTTCWYTFDQLIVTPELIQHRAAWNLDEETVRVWWCDELFTPKNNLSREFDHLPIVATLRFNASVTSRGDLP